MEGEGQNRRDPMWGSIHQLILLRKLMTGFGLKDGNEVDEEE
jgi:hypothetical protein